MGGPYHFTSRWHKNQCISESTESAAIPLSDIPLTARPSLWRHLLEASEIQTVNCKWRAENTGGSQTLGSDQTRCPRTEVENVLCKKIFF